MNRPIGKVVAARGAVIDVAFAAVLSTKLLSSREGSDLRSVLALARADEVIE
jgi:hypothetical protein